MRQTAVKERVAKKAVHTLVTLEPGEWYVIVNDRADALPFMKIDTSMKGTIPGDGCELATAITWNGAPCIHRMDQIVYPITFTDTDSNDNLIYELDE